MSDYEKETGGVIIHKCRRCGGLDKSLHVPDVLAALCCVTSGIPTPWKPSAMNPKMVGVHHCADGNHGVSDMIGGEIDKKERKT
jgi:hypothetical protein